MGRLFWKFFAFICLAQLGGIVAIASTFWLSQAGIDRSGARDVRHVPHFAEAGQPLDRRGPDRPPPPGEPGSPRFRSMPPIGPMVATLLASLVTAAMLAWYVAKPIKNLRHAFSQASAGRLDHRVAPSMGSRQDELADLGREFDRMAERLECAMQRQRRLLHDVSHEVRSPLARLQTAVGILRQKQSAHGTTIDRIEEEIARIDRLIAELLKLSRLEAGELAEEIQEVDLRELVAQVVEDAQFEAKPASRAIAWIDRPAATLRGRPEMLHVAFDNIVRNAIKHAPQGPVIEIQTSVDAAASQYVFRVLDTGPGVAPDDLDALFTPFFRAASSSAEGYGLGLAIARRSVEAHGGTIRAVNRTEGGLLIEVLLPL